MSDETRIRILVLLANEELCVCQLCGILDLPQPKVSKHLAKLRNMRYVNDTRKDQFVFYSLNTDEVMIEDFIGNIEKYVQVENKLKEDLQRLSEKDIYLNQCKACKNKN